MAEHDYSVEGVKKYLYDGTIRKCMSLKQRKSFLKYAKKFQFTDRMLYYVNASNKLQVLLTDENFNFKIGDKVLVKNYKKIGSKGNCMEHDWLGPAINTNFSQLELLCPLMVKFGNQL
nr:uncharacterized protein LOC124807863 [Hydra vulgaris]